MVAVVDIGSNTMRLSCYEIQKDGGFRCVIHKKEMAGLANYIEGNGKMTVEGIERAIAAIENFKVVFQHMELESVHFFATAAIRNTENKEEIVEKIQERTGYAIHILSGEEEAICDFVGVCDGQNVENGMVIDIGGGSTEMVIFENEKIIRANSFAVGSLNMYKRHVKDIVPIKSEISEMKSEVKKEMKHNLSKKKQLSTAYGVGGSIRAILRLYNVIYQRPEENRIMESDKIKKLLKMYNENKSDLVDQVIKIAPERLHTIIPGLTILCTILKQYCLDVVQVSNYGVREGYLIRYVM